LAGGQEQFKKILDSNDDEWQPDGGQHARAHRFSEKGNLIIPPLSVLVFEAIDQTM
jgi:hypothetical protein